MSQLIAYCRFRASGRPTMSRNRTKSEHAMLARATSQNTAAQNGLLAPSMMTARSMIAPPTMKLPKCTQTSHTGSVPSCKDLTTKVATNRAAITPSKATATSVLMAPRLVAAFV